MKIKKLLFGGIIASAMTLGLISAIGLNKSNALGVDAAPTADKVFIGDVSFDANPYYKNGDTTTFTGSSLEYNAYYDVSTGKLELNEYNGDKISCTSTESITINLTSHNEIDTTGGSDDLYGIFAKGGVTFTGDGDLDITLAKDDGHNSGIGIYSPENIAVHGSVELNIDVRGVTKAHQSGMRTDEGIYLGYSSALSIYATAHVDQLYAVYGIEVTAGDISFATSGNTYIELNVEEGNVSYNNAAIYLQASDSSVGNNGSMAVGGGGDITLVQNGSGFGIGILSDFDDTNNLEGTISFSSGATTIIEGFNYGIWNISEERATPSADISLSNHADVTIRSNKSYGKGIVSEQNGVLVDNAHLFVDVHDRPIDVAGNNGGLYITNTSTYGFDVTGSSQVELQSLSGINTYSDATCDFDLSGTGYFRFSIGGIAFPSLAGTFKVKLHPGTRFTNQNHYSWDDDSTATDGGRKIIHSYGYDDEILEIVAFNLPTSVTVEVNAFTLSGTKNYYVNDAVEATSDPTGYNAYYDKENAILYLKGYIGGIISLYGEGDGLFRICVENDSAISGETGIDVRGYASLEIYSTNFSYLNINATSASGDASCIKVANGDLTMFGAMNVRLVSEVTCTTDGTARGLNIGHQYSGGTVTFKDSVDISVLVRSYHEAAIQTAIYARSNIIFNAKVANSKFRFDTSSVTGGSYSIYAGSNIRFDSYKDITFLWSEKDGNYNQGPTYPANKITAIDNGIYNIDDEHFIASLYYGNGGHVDVINGTCDAASGNYLLGNVAILHADTISGLTFTGWNQISGTGTWEHDSQSNPTGELCVAGSEVVEATYNFVEKAPFFDSRGVTTDGIIVFKLRGTPSLVQIVSEDRSTTVYSSNYLSGTQITPGDVPADTYRLKATYGSNYLYSDPFVVDYTSAAHEYTMTFESGDGTGADVIVNRNYGGYSLPTFESTNFEAPAGYRFAGWYVTGGTYQPGTIWMVNNDYTFTATYEVIPQHTMSFVGGTGVTDGSMADQVKLEGENFVLPTSTFTYGDHMTFDYWEVNSVHYNAGDTIVATADMEATANYKYLDQHTLSFNAGDGSGSMLDIEKYSDENFVLPECEFEAPENFEFAYWSVNALAMDPGDEIPANANVVATAVYTRIQVTIQFDAGVGTGTMSNVEWGKGTDYPLPDSTFIAPAHKQFKCWLIGDDEYEPGDNYSVTGSVTFTAIYEDIIRNITFSAGEGSGTMAGLTKIDGQTYVLPDSTFVAPEHKQFKCWSIGGVEYAPGAEYTVESDITITAIFEDITHNVTFSAGEGSGSMAAASVVEGQSYTLPNCTFEAPAHKHFKCWLIGETEYAEGASVVINSNTLVTAVYEDTMCEVSFSAGEGSGSMAGTSLVEGSTYVLPECTFTAPEGKEFDGWMVGGVKHAAGDEITISSDTTITAVFKDLPAPDQPDTPVTPDQPDTPITPDQPDTPVTPENPPKQGLSGGAVAGIVIASVVVVGVGGFALTWFVILKKSFADFLAIFKKK